jgi:trans-aconitate methyltransferase
VGWKTAESQKVRFKALARVAPLNGSKILDVGCGLGAFWGYLQKRKISVQYTGIDLFPNMIQEARELYPDVRFEVRHILARPYSPKSFDYSFLSGVFNVKVRDNWTYMRAMLKQVFRQTDKAVALNALNAESGIRESNRFMVTPEEMAALGRAMGAKRTRLLKNYHPKDLTLFLYR